MVRQLCEQIKFNYAAITSDFNEKVISHCFIFGNQPRAADIQSNAFKLQFATIITGVCSCKNN